MKLLARFCALAVLLGSMGVAMPAWAETTAFTKISQIQVLEPADEKYQLYHGVLWLELDKATGNYRWGGRHCKNAGLSKNSLSLLLAAFRGKHGVSVHYKRHQHADQIYRCITGVTIGR